MGNDTHDRRQQNPLLEFRPERASSLAIDRQAGPPLGTEPRKAVTAQVPPRTVQARAPSPLVSRLLRSPLRPFAVGSLFGAVVVWAMTSGASVETPPSRPAGAAMEVIERPAAASPLYVAPPASPTQKEALLAAPLVPDGAVSQRQDAAATRGVPGVRSVRPDAPARRANGVTSAPARLPAFRGSVAIASVPAGARVFVNSQPTGVTPLVLKDLPVGSRAIRVEAHGYTSWSSVVRVVADRLTSVNTTLSPAAQSDPMP